MSRLVLLLLSALLLPSVIAARLSAAEWDDAEFEPIASGNACPARIALRQEGDRLAVALDIDALPGCAAGPAVVLAVAATGQQMLTAAAPTASAGGRHRFTFAVSGIAKGAAEWAQLRLAVGATFPGLIDGQPRYRARYRLLDGRALHAELPSRAQDWQPFDLNAYRQRVADRRARVVIAFDQPLAGKATVVIDDAAGRRVRNLVSGAPFAKGRQAVDWDLLDDDGHVVPPGDYTFRTLHHAGIVPEYRFSFCNDGNPPWRTGSGDDMWGPDHSCFTSVAAVGDRVLFLSPCAEAGYPGAITDLLGVKHGTWGPPVPPGRFLLAGGADGEVFVAADDGKRQVLLRYLPGKEWVPFAAGEKEVVWGGTAASGFGRDDTAFSQARWDDFSLAGFARCGDRLVVASRPDHGLLVFAAAGGKPLATIPLARPGALAGLPDGTLLAVSAGAIVRVAPGATVATPFVPAGRLDPGAMAPGGDGRLYVIDQGTSQVVILDSATGRELGRLGKPGGAYAGPYDAERMVRPLGLAVAANGWLWVTENRFNPKRVLAWDLGTGRVVKEKFGSTSYGAPGAGLDGSDATRAVGQGALWKLDLARRTAVPTSILFADPDLMPNAMHWRFVRRDGRTFLLGFNGCNSLLELKADGSARLLAQYGSAQGYAIGRGQRLAPAFLETFYRQRGFDTAEKRTHLHEGRFPHNKELFLWSDIDGDGQMQAGELEFSDRFDGGYWGADGEGLDLTIPLSADLGGRPGNWRLDLPLLGWHPSGAPRWGALAAAVAAAPELQPAHWGNESALTDRHGLLYTNGDERVMAFGADRALRWTYPSRWNGVHGSHAAPLPSPGQLQGALFFLGNAPLPDGKTDVVVINGNHGRFFALTSDGFYLDEFFKDVRMGSVIDAYLIGGECFGGSFCRGADGVYYLLSGHTDYRVFTMRGFDSIVRGPGGRVQVAPAQIEAADRRAQAAVALPAGPRTATLARLAAPPALDGSGSGWPAAPLAAWSRDGRFAVEVTGGWDATALYLRWSVEDPSPWLNHGGDERLLFKTGDSVDLQLGSDPAALANRTEPAPGDLRLLIAPFHGTAIAQLYRHRVPGTTAPVPFSSPWRTANVDVVRRLAGARLNVAVGRNAANQPGYIVEAAIPLAELGLAPDPARAYRADLGAIFGDPDGQMDQLRSYWSNQATGLVNDVPGEIMLFPGTWGTIRFTGGT